jgi:hypothetical protein
VSEFRDPPHRLCKAESKQIKLNDHLTAIASMSEEPLFDSSFKKKPKKKQVAFSEDPLGADADPTQPAPDVIDNRTTNGEAVDMGPTTAHEQLAQQQSSEVDDDFKAMFGDVKKKKKSKKEIPLDLVRVTTPIIPPSISLVPRKKDLVPPHLQQALPMILTFLISRKRRKRRNPPSI